MRNNAQDANLPQRGDDPGNRAVPAASAATPSASTSDRKLPGRIRGPGGHDLPGAAAATAAATSA